MRKSPLNSGFKLPGTWTKIKIKTQKKVKHGREKEKPPYPSFVGS